MSENAPTFNVVFSPPPRDPDTAKPAPAPEAMFPMAFSPPKRRGRGKQSKKQLQRERERMEAKKRPPPPKPWKLKASQRGNNENVALNANGVMWLGGKTPEQPKAPPPDPAAGVEEKWRLLKEMESQIEAERAAAATHREILTPSSVKSASPPATPSAPSATAIAALADATDRAQRAETEVLSLTERCAELKGDALSKQQRLEELTMVLSEQTSHAEACAKRVELLESEACGHLEELQRSSEERARLSERLEEAKAARSSEESRLSEELSAAKSARDALSARLDYCEAAREGLSSELRALKASLQDADARAAALSDARAASAERLGAASASASALESHLRASEAHGASLEARASQLEASLREAQEERQRLAAELLEAEKARREALERGLGAERDLALANAAVARLEASLGDLRAEGAAVGPLREALAAKEEELRAVRTAGGAAAAPLREALAAKEEELRALRSREAELRGLLGETKASQERAAEDCRASLVELRAHAKGIAEQLAAKEAETARLRDRCEVLDRGLSEASARAEAAEASIEGLSRGAGPQEAALEAALEAARADRKEAEAQWEREARRLEERLRGAALELSEKERALSALAERAASAESASEALRLERSADRKAREEAFKVAEEARAGAGAAGARLEELRARLAASEASEKELRERVAALGRDGERGLLDRAALLRAREEEHEASVSAVRDAAREARQALERELAGERRAAGALEQRVEELSRRLRAAEGATASASAALEGALGALEEERAGRRGAEARAAALGEDCEALRARAQRADALRAALHNKVLQLKGNVRVFVRARPLLEGGGRGEMALLGEGVLGGGTEGAERGYRFGGGQRAEGEGTEGCRRLEVFDTEERRGGLGDRRKRWRFSFDRVFEPLATQADVYQEVAPLVQSAVDGHRVCVFAFGQTGAGKTFTMLGEEGGTAGPRGPRSAGGAAGALLGRAASWGEDAAPGEGIVARAMAHAFAACGALEAEGWTFTQRLELVEVYNGQILDLLEPRARRKALELRLLEGSAERGSFEGLRVAGLGARRVRSAAEAAEVVRESVGERAVRATRCNAESSRSHCIVTLCIEGRNRRFGLRRSGRLHLVDLAGSERIHRSGSVDDGDALREATAINGSLTALGNVIAALKKGDRHVPFRDSALTHLLQGCLGGRDAKALMLCCLAPERRHLAESLNSLRFARKVAGVLVGDGPKLS